MTAIVELRRGERRVSPRPGISTRPVGNAGRSTAGISIASAAVIFGLWWASAASGLVPHLFLPAPSEVVAQFVAAATDGYANATLLSHTAASLVRIVSAFALATVLGVPIGLAMGTNRWVKGIIDAPMHFYWPLPPLAYLPLLIIWCGIGEFSKILLLTLAMFAPICLAAQSGVRGVRIERVQAALSLGARPRQIFRTIVLPSALPEILTGLRIAVGVGWSTLVAAELIASTRGIGFMIMSASEFLATDVVFVGIVIIAAFAFAFSMGMRTIERKLVPWKGKD